MSGGFESCVNTTTNVFVNVIRHMNRHVFLHKNTDAFVFTDVIRHVIRGVFIVTISKNNVHTVTFLLVSCNNFTVTEDV